MPDEILRLGSSLLQHGPDSDRVYIMKMVPEDAHLVLDDAEALATRRGYGKIVVKARASDYGELTQRGFRVEAVVPHFHENGEAGLFAGRFLDEARASDPDAARIRQVVEAAEVAHLTAGNASGGTDLTLGEAGPEDAEDLAACYADVFESYPFPIDDPAHLRAQQLDGTRYYTAREGGRDAESDARAAAGPLVGASAMEPGGSPTAVEMTDFATLPSHRGRGVAARLLGLMDCHALEAGVRVAYTIARAGSFPMNITFGRRGYRYAGTLVNNTWIGGAIESMNVWYKILEDRP